MKMMGNNVAVEVGKEKVRKEESNGENQKKENKNIEGERDR